MLALAVYKGDSHVPREVGSVQQEGFRGRSISHAGMARLGTPWETGRLTAKSSLWPYFRVTYTQGGNVQVAGGAPSNKILRWDRAHWNAVGNGVDDTVRALLVRNDVLVLGGDFTEVGQTPASGVATWDGNAWGSLGDGLNGWVFSLAEYNGELIAAGDFTASGSTPISRVARWDGAAWNPVGSGVNGVAWSLTSYQQVLVAGGSFTEAGGDSGNCLHCPVGWGLLGTGGWRRQL